MLEPYPEIPDDFPFLFTWAYDGVCYIEDCGNTLAVGKIHRKGSGELELYRSDYNPDTETEYQLLFTGTWKELLAYMLVCKEQLLSELDG